MCFQIYPLSTVFSLVYNGMTIIWIEMVGKSSLEAHKIDTFCSCSSQESNRLQHSSKQWCCNISHQASRERRQETKVTEYKKNSFMKPKKAIRIPIRKQRIKILTLYWCLEDLFLVLGRWVWFISFIRLQIKWKEKVFGRNTLPPRKEKELNSILYRWYFKTTPN